MLSPKIAGRRISAEETAESRAIIEQTVRVTKRRDTALVLFISWLLTKTTPGFGAAGHWYQYTIVRAISKHQAKIPARQSGGGELLWVFCVPQVSCVLRSPVLPSICANPITS